MKRLLAYLFIVLGLGLTFNVSAEAKEVFGKGVSIALDPRSLGMQIDDSVMQKKLAAKLIAKNKSYKLSVSTKVKNGKIFLTGKIENAEEKLQITKLAWEITGVRSVKNNIKIKEKFKQSAKDLLIASQLRVALIINNKIKSSNYQIDTYNKKIYVYGIALTSEEKELVISAANEIVDVEDVIPSIFLVEELKAQKNIQIAKVEPSQTQKVVKKVKANENFKLTKNEVDSLFSSVSNCWSLPLGLPYNKDLSIKIKVNLDETGSVIRTEILDHSKINKKGNGYLKVLAESALRAIKLCSPLKVPNGKYPLWQQIVFNFDANEVLNGIESEDTKIAKNNLLNKTIEFNQTIKKEKGKKQKFAQFDFKANQIILINSNTNQILYEKNADQKINPASFTKIMTSIIVFDAIKNGQISLKDKLRVSKKAWKISTSGYSAMFVMNGDSISVENLLRGLIVASGNDAAIVLAEGLAGSENNFVKLMNDKAKEIGLNYTKFGNSTGIIIPTNTTTVKDVAIMSSYLINNYPELYYFFGEKQFTWNRTGGDPITQGNRNPLLYKNMNVDGLRTSYNQTDRYGLASSMYLKNNDDRLIVVGSGFKDKNARSKGSAQLLTLGKTNYHTFKIAKKEPNQTIANTDITRSDNFVCVDEFQYNKENNSYTLISKGSIKDSNCVFNISKSLNPKIYNELIEYMKSKSLSGSIAKSSHISKPLFDKIKGSKIAKAEPTIKPKKKVKVAKKEPKQEEFKPKKTNQDNEAPVITIAEAITVDSQAYTLKGKVKDKSRFQLTIDDRPIKVAKNGQFEFEGFAIDSKEQLKIVAIDRWKNKSEKIINVEVKIKQVADLRSYEKPNPSKIKVKKDNNKIGIIIGIEKYQNLNNIDAPYANRDAKAFKAYANIALGIPNNNLKVLIDEDATRGELLKSLKIWLPQITRGKEKDIYIFFAGHGLASDDGKDLHILPHNGDPILLEDTALSRIQMFDLINKVSPKSVTMFFDTCYSGQTRSEQMLVAGLRPVRIVADEQDTPNNFTIFTASNYDQTSGSINEAEHGIFSYYLMKGLEGNADANKDKKLTNGELIAYLKSNVSQEAFSQNRSQEPMLAGDLDKVLMSYR